MAKKKECPLEEGHNGHKYRIDYQKATIRRYLGYPSNCVEISVDVYW